MPRAQASSGPPAEGEPVSGRSPSLLASLWWAARLRCPLCGASRVLESWFELAPACPGCGLEMDRGEEDHFLGAVLLNLVVDELAVAVAATVVIVLTWPDVPWTGITVGCVALAAGLPVATYPFSRLLWLAADLYIRPDAS